MIRVMRESQIKSEAESENESLVSPGLAVIWRKVSQHWLRTPHFTPSPAQSITTIAKAHCRRLYIKDGLTGNVLVHNMTTITITNTTTTAATPIINDGLWLLHRQLSAGFLKNNQGGLVTQSNE